MPQLEFFIIERLVKAKEINVNSSRNLEENNGIEKLVMKHIHKLEIYELSLYNVIYFPIIFGNKYFNSIIWEIPFFFFKAIITLGE